MNAPRSNDMAKVHGMIMRLGMQYRGNTRLQKVVVYVALHLAGFRTLDQIPVNARNVLQELRSI